MNTFFKLRSGRSAAWTLTELMVSMAASTILCCGLVTGSILLQKCFLASRKHVIAQAEQMLLMDYMNLDLRRALTVSTNFGKLTLTIPDYYDSTGNPRDPQIHNGTAVYGPSPKTISYYQNGATIYRSDGATLLPLATNVSDFQLAFQDFGQSIKVSISFIPTFQFSTTGQANARNGTATYTTTLLRNKRQG